MFLSSELLLLACLPGIGPGDRKLEEGSLSRGISFGSLKIGTIPACYSLLRAVLLPWLLTGLLIEFCEELCLNLGLLDWEFYLLAVPIKLCLAERLRAASSMRYFLSYIFLTSLA